MSDLTSVERLAKLRTLEAWLDWQLHDTRRKIATLEAEASPPVGYVVEKKVRDDHPLGAIVHLATCTMPERDTRPISANDARLAPADRCRMTGPSRREPCAGSGPGARGS